jgi:hypothetical protein
LEPEAPYGQVRGDQTARPASWIAAHDMLPTFRATGITTYLQNGGTIEHAQQTPAPPPATAGAGVVNHPLTRTCGELPRTLARLPAAGRATKLYDRTNDAMSLDERACPAFPGIERILSWRETVTALETSARGLAAKPAPSTWLNE